MAYETEISFPYTWLRHEEDSDEQPSATPPLIGHTRPFFTVQMHYTDSPDAETRSAVLNSWLEYADSGLEMGWKSSSEKSGDDIRVFGEPDDVLIYEHESHRQARFWFPVPMNTTLPAAWEHKYIGTTGTAGWSIMPPRNPRYLHFRTTSGHFRLGKPGHNATEILTLGDGSVGTLYPHDELDPEFISATNDASEIRPTIELIAIFGNTIPNEDFEVWTESRNRDGIKHRPVHRHRDPKMYRSRDIYNVMWVQRVDGIYYRKATGVVDRDAWDAHAQDMVNVILG